METLHLRKKLAVSLVNRMVNRRRFCFGHHGLCFLARQESAVKNTSEAISPPYPAALENITVQRGEKNRKRKEESFIFTSRSTSN